MFGQRLFFVPSQHKEIAQYPFLDLEIGGMKVKYIGPLFSLVTFVPTPPVWRMPNQRPSLRLARRFDRPQSIRLDWMLLAPAKPFVVRLIYKRQNVKGESMQLMTRAKAPAGRDNSTCETSLSLPGKKL